eukprot:ctg_3067.g574
MSTLYLADAADVPAPAIGRPRFSAAAGVSAQRRQFSPPDDDHRSPEALGTDAHTSVCVDSSGGGLRVGAPLYSSDAVEALATRRLGAVRRNTARRNPRRRHLSGSATGADHHPGAAAKAAGQPTVICVFLGAGGRRDRHHRVVPVEHHPLPYHHSGGQHAVRCVCHRTGHRRGHHPVRRRRHRLRHRGHHGGDPVLRRDFTEDTRRPQQRQGGAADAAAAALAVVATVPHRAGVLLSGQCGADDVRSGELVGAAGVGARTATDHCGSAAVRRHQPARVGDDRVGVGSGGDRSARGHGAARGHDLRRWRDHGAGVSGGGARDALLAVSGVPRQCGQHHRRAVRETTAGVCGKAGRAAGDDHGGRIGGSGAVCAREHAGVAGAGADAQEAHPHGHRGRREIVGEIYDEDDHDYEQREQEIREQSPGRWLMDGQAELDKVVDALGMKLRDEDLREYGTIGGLLCDRMGGIPSAGDSIVIVEFRFVVEAADDRRIVKVRAERLSEDEVRQLEAVAAAEAAAAEGGALENREGNGGVDGMLGDGAERRDGGGSIEMQGERRAESFNGPSTPDAGNKKEERRERRR